LADVEMPAAECERPRHRLPLVVEGGAGQIEVHLVGARLRLLGRQKPDPEPGVIARQQRKAVGAVVRLPAQDAAPEVCEQARVVGIEAERKKVTAHEASKGAR
jgi:hypothetical protein